MRLLAALLSLLLTFSCSPRSTVPPPPAAPVPSDPTAPGMVWRVSNPETKTFLYLAGSFHLLRASDYPLPSPYETAWTASTHLLLEIPPGDATSPETKAALAPLLSLPPGEKLQDRLPPEIWASLAAWSQHNKFSLNNFQSTPPWLAALTVTVTTAKFLGFDSSHGIEQHFAARLPGSGKTTEGLETAIGQMSLLKNLPPAVHQAMLQQALMDVDLLPEKPPPSPRHGGKATPKPCTTPSASASRISRTSKKSSSPIATPHGSHASNPS
ncbi:MAG: hypothetical protein JWL81_2709 [Verrucomicrobiales bacterium]|nr:hypothetical protein [Verrucomicrobiales bacterium]